MLRLTALAVLVTALFALTPLDLEAARLFYSPLAGDHWPLAALWPWSALYRLAPVLTVCLVVAALGALGMALLRRDAVRRRYAVFVLLSIGLGPGLLVNAVFKDHWERPRPRDIVQFEGSLQYVPAPLRGAGGGSFPCGHCSVGFLYALGFWIWRYRRPAWARASLAGGLIAGGLLGIGRMAAGAHFLSDVVWSALLSFAVAEALYQYVLRIPQHEARESAGTLAPVTPAVEWSTILAAVCALAVLGALLASPHGTLLRQRWCPASGVRGPRVFSATARAADITIVVLDAPSAAPNAAASACISVSGELHGFGLPMSRMGSGFEFDPARSALTYRIEQRGWFTDLGGDALIDLPAGDLERIVVRVERGNIKVTDLTRAALVERGLLALDIKAAAGRVEPMPRAPRG